MTTLQLTLSRAHKLTERLKARASECFAQAREQASVVSMQSAPTAQQLDRLRRCGSRSVTLIAQAERYLAEYGKLRAAIGRENERRGISSQLAQIDVKRRLVSELRALGWFTASDGTVPLDEVSSLPRFNQEQSGGAVPQYAQPPVAVRVVSDADLAAISERLSGLRSEIIFLEDTLAELNAGRMNVELPDDIAAELTGGQPAAH